MMKPVFFALLAAVLLAQGCSMQRGYIENPFEHDPRQTFIREETGETGLYIEDETWCALIDLHGFKDPGLTLENDEFLVRKNGRGTLVSISAEKTDEVTGNASCQERIFQKLPDGNADSVRVRTLGGRSVMVSTFRGRKRVDYCPFYRGYCFDFQFSLDEKYTEKSLERVLQSIVFTSNRSVKGMTQKIFYIYDTKVQFGMPDTWEYQIKAGLQNTPTIKFTPLVGNAFSMYLSPYRGFDRDTAVTRDQVAALFKAKQEAWEERNADDAPVVEIFDDKKDLYITYFDVTDRYHHDADKNEYPYQRHGYALMGKAAFSFIMLFRDDGRADVEKGISGLEHMKLLDLATDPVISIPDPKK